MTSGRPAEIQPDGSAAPGAVEALDGWLPDSLVPGVHPAHSPAREVIRVWDGGGSLPTKGWPVLKGIADFCVSRATRLCRESGGGRDPLVLDMRVGA